MTDHYWTNTRTYVRSSAGIIHPFVRSACVVVIPSSHASYRSHLVVVLIPLGFRDVFPVSCSLTNLTESGSFHVYYIVGLCTRYYVLTWPCPFRGRRFPVYLGLRKKRRKRRPVSKLLINPMDSNIFFKGSHETGSFPVLQSCTALSHLVLFRHLVVSSCLPLRSHVYLASCPDLLKQTKV